VSTVTGYGVPAERSGIPEKPRQLISSERFRAGMFIGEHGPDSAEVIGALLEELGLRPYKPGKPAKFRAEQAAPIINYTRPGS
jgi:hypothetical protein